MVSLAYLWEKPDGELLQNMIDGQMNSIIIKVASYGLDKRHLGMNLEQIRPVMLKLKEKTQVHVCGEGGEFESLTLDCPIYKKRIEM